MILDKSFGAVALRRPKGEWEVLIVQPHWGFWGLPKGHPDPGETPQQTLERELFEETNLRVVRYLSARIFTEQYQFQHHKQRIDKTVYYYLVEAEGVVALQENELKSYVWIPLVRSEERVTYPETKKVLLAAQAELINI